MSYESFSGQNAKNLDYYEEDTRNWIQTVLDPENKKAQENDLNSHGWENNPTETRQKFAEKLTGAAALG